MNGIRVVRLSGIEPGSEYRRIDGIGHVGNSAPLGREFENLGCTCQNLGSCSESDKAEQLLREFEQRVKNHLINTYNYIVKNRANCGVANPDLVATAYKRIIDNWNDRIAREQAMTEAERLIQNDDQIAQDFAKKMAADAKIQGATLVKLRSKLIPKMTARRRATVINGLGAIGELDYEILPESVPQAMGTVIADFGEMGMAGTGDDVTISLGATMIPFSEIDYLGDDGEEEVYLLQGILGKTKKKVQIKIKPKNAIKAIKKATKAVANTAKTVAKKTGEAAKKATAKVKEVAKKAAKAVIKYNPLFVAGRNGFLLAAKLNIKNIARKLMWGYATLDQAKKAGFSQADWEKAKEGVKKAESIFVGKAGGNANALRKAVLSSKPAKQYGLGADPATLTAIAAATPLIVAIVQALRDVKVAKAGGAPVLDPDGTGENIPDGEGMPISSEGSSSGSSAQTEIDQKSESSYQNVPSSEAPNSSYPSNNQPYQESGSNTSSSTQLPTGTSPEQSVPTSSTPVQDPNSKTSGSSGGSGLLMGGLALAAIGIVAVSGKKTKGKLDGVSKKPTGRPYNKVEKITID